MIKATCTLILSILLISSAMSEDLSRDRQLEIIKNYLLATRQTDALRTLSLGDEFPEDVTLPLKCGTPAVTEFVLNRDKLDDDLAKTLGTLLEPRPTNLNLSVTSPSGIFRIHYTNTGSDAVLSPDYPNSVAAIYDEVYDHIVNTLGFPPPPSDGFPF